jgi:hypothetical protein
LFTLHAIWPFLWIWATLYRDDRGYGFSETSTGDTGVAQLRAELAALEARMARLEGEPKLPAEPMRDTHPAPAA